MPEVVNYSTKRHLDECLTPCVLFLKSVAKWLLLCNFDQGSFFRDSIKGLSRLWLNFNCNFTMCLIGNNRKTCCIVKFIHFSHALHGKSSFTATHTEGTEVKKLYNSCPKSDHLINKKTVRPTYFNNGKMMWHDNSFAFKNHAKLLPFSSELLL